MRPSALLQRHGRAAASAARRCCTPLPTQHATASAACAASACSRSAGGNVSTSGSAEASSSGQHAWSQRSRHVASMGGSSRSLATRAVATTPSTAASSSSVAEVEYEAVIGIETHVQLLTRSKAFCSCPSEYGAEPNANVCPVCLGHPGALPVVNAEMATLAVRMGLALNSTIARRSKFDRKQYFYPDLPKGYQISQYDEPICQGGHVEVQQQDGSTKRFGVTRAHLEEDAGKTVYGGADRLAGSEYSLVDYNRAGVPLLEIVSEPEMRNGKDAYAYGDELRRIVRFLGISDGNMAEGSMRCDVNISVRPKGRDRFGTKVEIKNMNNFSNMQKAIDFEFERQVALARAGAEHEIVQETRLWDEVKQQTFSMRKKEGLADYRYFPEPDLPPLVVTEEMVEAVKASMPELPSAKRARYLALGLPMYDVLILAGDVATARMFDACVSQGVAPKTASNWIMGDISAYCNEKKLSMDQLAIAPAALAEMIRLIEDTTISGKIAKDILPELLEGKGNAGVKAFVEKKGLLMISDEAAIASMVSTVLAANPKELADYRGGKTKLQGFFQGLVMKESKGRVNPQLMQQILVKMLKDALTAKLRPGATDQALNAGLLKAIDLVTAFLVQEVENAGALEQLKAEVKRTLVSQAQRAKAASAPTSQQHDTSTCSLGRPLFPRISTQHAGMSSSAASAAGSVAGGPPAAWGGRPRQQKAQKQQQTQQQTQQTQQQGGARASAEHASLLQLELDPPTPSGAANGALPQLDWSMPQQLLNRKAFAQGGRNSDVFDRMVVQQDELAQQANQERLRQRKLGMQKTREMYDEQLAAVTAKRQAERQAKLREKQELEQLIRTVKEEERDKKQRAMELQAQTRQMYQGQVDEVLQRRNLDKEQHLREAQLERQQVERDLRRERERKEEAARQSRVHSEAARSALDAAMQLKEQELLHLQEEERKAVKEYAKVMEEREARRVAQLAQRAEKQRAAYERAGGVAMQANLEEEAKREAARTERLRLEREAKEEAEVADRKERQQRDKENRAKAIQEQLEYRQAQREREAADMRALKQRMDDQLQAEKARDRAQRESERERKAQELARLKADMEEQHRRSQQQYVHRIPEADKWIASGVLEGRERGFANFSVPPTFLATQRAAKAGA